MANNYDDDDIITLTTSSGEDIDFVEVAGISYRKKFYVILQPVELLEGMSEDEALVFHMYKGKNGQDQFDIELDDKIIDAVFREYNKSFCEHNRKLRQAKNKQNFSNAVTAVTHGVKTIVNIVMVIIGIIVALGGVGMIIAGVNQSEIAVIIVGTVGALIGLLVFGRGFKGLRNNKK